jgi:hypothetical protein
LISASYPVIGLSLLLQTASLGAFPRTRGVF